MAHDDLNRILADFQANETALQDVTRDLSEQQLNWRPANGTSWSILQCISHLALTNDGYSGAIRSVLRADGPCRNGPIRPSAPGAFFLKKIEPPVTKRVKAPPKIAPQPALSKDTVLMEFLRSHETIRNIVSAANDLDLNRLKFRSPFIPLLRVRVGTALLIMAGHERRHLWQAQQVRKAVQP